jgi:hypothetical protein
MPPVSPDIEGIIDNFEDYGGVFNGGGIAVLRTV